LTFFDFIDGSEEKHVAQCNALPLVGMDEISLCDVFLEKIALLLPSTNGRDKTTFMTRVVATPFQSSCRSCIGLMNRRPKLLLVSIRSM